MSSTTTAEPALATEAGRRGHDDRFVNGRAGEGEETPREAAFVVAQEEGAPTVVARRHNTGLPLGEFAKPTELFAYNCDIHPIEKVVDSGLDFRRGSFGVESAEAVGRIASLLICRTALLFIGEAGADCEEEEKKVVEVPFPVPADEQFFGADGRFVGLVRRGDCIAVAAASMADGGVNASCASAARACSAALSGDRGYDFDIICVEQKEKQEGWGGVERLFFFKRNVLVWMVVSLRAGASRVGLASGVR